MPDVNPRCSNRAVVLLSGGIDSAVCLALAAEAGFETHAIAFRYGQRHIIEVAHAQAVAEHLSARTFTVVDVGLDSFGGSPMTDHSIAVPEYRTESEMAAGTAPTYVPARNPIFLSLALARAVEIDAMDIFFGANADDQAGYPDCRADFVSAFRGMARYAVERPINIHAPLVGMSKAEIVRDGIRLGVDLGLTLSCYQPDHAGKPCGKCDACIIRRRAFAEVKQCPTL